jgi:hypothetical protein
LDAGLLLAFLLSFWLDLTGLSIHQWLGMALAVAVGVHLLVHWSWVKSVTQRFFGRTSAQARGYYLVDASLLLGFSSILLTGLVISTWLGLSLANYALWQNLHVFSSVFTLLVVVFKLALHWRWIVKVARRYVFTPEALQPAKAPMLLATAPVHTERRDFLCLMGLVSVAAVISIANVLETEQQTVASASAEDQKSSVETNLSLSAANSLEVSETESSTPDSGSSTSSCRVQCNHRCSYPGHCRRYTDSNSNNCCDYGECM